MKKESFPNAYARYLEVKDEGDMEGNTSPSCVLLSGTKIVNGEGKYLVISVGPYSAMGKIKELVNEDEETTPLQNKLETIARDIGNFGLISAIFTVVFLFIRFGIDLSRSSTGWDENRHPGELVSYIIIGITIVVVAIPEGLPLAVTLSLAYSVKKMLNENNLVRKLHACETMGGAQVICTDKTGTLTKNEMTLVEFWNGEHHKTFNTHEGATVHYSEFVPKDLENLFVNTICVNSSEDPDAKHGQATELAVLQYLKSCGIDCLRVRGSADLELKVPFSSSRKRSTVVVGESESKTKHRMYMKGASEYILASCSHIRYFTNKDSTPLKDEDHKKVDAAIYQMANSSLRTIGVAYKDVTEKEFANMEHDTRGVYNFEKDGWTLLGVYGIKDVLRPGVKQSIKLCKEAGVRIRMVTGDNKVTARAIAIECGILNEDNGDTIMDGNDFYTQIGGVIDKPKEKKLGLEGEIEEEEEEEESDRKCVANKEKFLELAANLAVMSRSRPEDKHALVTGLRECGQVVAVTGDGTNDAPALTKADVGFAMGITGTDVAKGACDIVLLDDNFSSIITALKYGRNVFDNVRKFLQF